MNKEKKRMGVIMENSSTAALLLLHNVINPLVSSADKSLLSLSKKSKLLHRLLASLFLLLLHFFHSLPSSFIPFSLENYNGNNNNDDNDSDRSFHHKAMIIRHIGSSSNDNIASARYGGLAIARALHQLLELVSNIPVSSTKYDVVRCLAEKLINENLQYGSEVLREVNSVVLSQAFGRTLTQLEAALSDQDCGGLGCAESGLGRAVRAATGWYWKSRARGGGAEHNWATSELSVEKMVAELLWLAQKMEASGGVEVAVEKWAWALNLGWLALSAEARTQSSLVKLTAFLIKQAKGMGKEQDTGGGETEQQKQTKMKMLMTWVPLLCRASNGTDAPTLSTSERGDIERALEEIIDKLEEEADQEKVLSLWLHHFTQCPSSDWPNLYNSYTRWCTVSCKLLLTQ